MIIYAGTSSKIGMEVGYSEAFYVALASFTFHYFSVVCLYREICTSFIAPSIQARVWFLCRNMLKEFLTRRIVHIL